jgi:hypothetical protein
MLSINPVLFVAAILANLAAVRMQAFILPDSLYFSFSAFLFDNRDLDKPVAIAVKLAIPAVVSFLSVYLIANAQKARLKSLGDSGGLDRVLADQVAITLAFAAFAAAFLLAWPYILLWDILVDPLLHRHRILFLLAYLAYFTAYAYFAVAGANTAKAVLTKRAIMPPLTVQGLLEHPYIRPLMNVVSGTASTFLSTFLASRVDL